MNGKLDPRGSTMKSVLGLGHWVMAACLLACAAPAALAGEGSGSHYLPGAYGDWDAGKISGAGGFLRTDLFHVDASADQAFLGGETYAKVTQKCWVLLPQVRYFTETKILDGQYGFGFSVPVILDAQYDGMLVVGPDQFAREDDGRGFGDLQLTPLILGWETGNIRYMFFQTIHAPTGSFKEGRLVNLSRNHWALSSNFGFTWRPPKRGYEASFTAGLLLNTSNATTNYQGGNEMHLDFLLGYHLSDRLAVGLTGYYYKQLTGDNGAGAVFGPFEGRASGVGPTVKWTHKAGDKPVDLIAKWSHDSSADHYFEGDRIVVSVALGL